MSFNNKIFPFLVADLIVNNHLDRFKKILIELKPRKHKKDFENKHKTWPVFLILPQVDHWNRQICRAGV